MRLKLKIKTLGQLARWALRTGVVSLLVATANAQSTTNVTAYFNMLINPADLAGMDTNSYCTNFNYILYTTTDCSQPLTNWQYFMSIPVAPLLTQGSPPTYWSNIISVDLNSRFFVGQFTNFTSGGAGPFSVTAPLLWRPPGGQIKVRK